MSISQIRINGIRLNSGLIQVLQPSAIGDKESGTPLYQRLALGRINISCLGLRTDASGTSVFCCHDLKSGVKSGANSDSNHPDQPENPVGEFTSNFHVLTVSVYPHNSSMNTLGFLIELFGKNQIAFQQMVSSNAMITFVIDGVYQKKLLELLEQKFDLPPTHTPFQQDFNDETAAFVKKRYPETRATYVEEKIKTYGIQTVTGLEMFEICFNPNLPEHLEICGKALQALFRSTEKFYFTAVLTRGREESSLFCVTNPVKDPVKDQARQSFFSQLQVAGGIDICQPLSVDLINFHGPHFGDRFGIFNTAMGCLKASSIDVLLAGCTGASICMVLPATCGKKAIVALGKGFETP